MRHRKRSILISGLMSPVVAFLIVAVSRYLGRSIVWTRRASTWPLATDPARSPARAPAMTEELVVIDGGGPLPAKLVEEWRAEAARQGLADWLEVAYVMNAADAYRREQAAVARENVKALQTIAEWALGPRRQPPTARRR